jgi:hypothetical protein
MGAGAERVPARHSSTFEQSLRDEGSGKLSTFYLVNHKAAHLASRSATVLGMAILKDAILSIVLAVVAIIGAKALGWAWYILGLLWLGQ